MAVRTVVTLGPSLTHSEAAHLLPFAEIRAPIAAGDALGFGLGRGDTLLIIDGVFHHDLPVRHKEILRLLETGVRVVGSSSMGALRAVELASAGMVGKGQIFELYRRRPETSDEEVALAHLGTDDDFRPYRFQR